jgi:hypothetical protein
MNRKTLSTAVLALAATLSVPLAQAGHHDDDDYREVHVQNNYYYPDHPGQHRGWYEHRHYERRDYHEHEAYYPAPRGYREEYPVERSSSPVPIIAGSVIGGVVGHDIGRGDPRDTALGAVVGTIIGYEVVRHR